MLDVKKVLDFWFQGISDTTKIEKRKPPFSFWFRSSKDFDQKIRDAFERDYLNLREGNQQEQIQSPQDALAAIIVLDQFSRNMYRNSTRMYESDELALNLAIKTIDQGFDQKLQLIERVFAYTPFMHAEDKNMQERHVQLIEQLVDESKEKCPDNTWYYEYTLRYAWKYLATIKEFGRFPHRDKVLNRN